MSEYKVYWPMDFPLINSWVCPERIVLLKWHALVIKKQTNKYKEKLVISQSIEIIVRLL